MSVSAVSGSVQIYPSVTLNARNALPSAVVIQPLPKDDVSTTAPSTDVAVKHQQDAVQQQQVAQSIQLQAQNNNQIAVNFFA